MYLASPVCCDLQGFKRFKTIVSKTETLEGLIEAALAISLQLTGRYLNFKKVDSVAQGIADKVRGRVHGSQPQAMLAHLNDVFYEEHGFRAESYDDVVLQSFCLPTLLEERVGHPDVLGIVYKAVAHRLGFCVEGALFGECQFVLRLHDHQSMFISPATGTEVTEEEYWQRLLATEGVHPHDKRRSEVASNNRWLTHLLQRSLEVYSCADNYHGVGAVLEMQYLLNPQSVKLAHDLVLVWCKVEKYRSALHMLDYCLSLPESSHVWSKRKELLALREVILTKQ